MIKILKKLPAAIKPGSVQTMSLGMKHRLFFCFIAGVVVGTFLTNFIGAAYADKIGIYSRYSMGNAGNMDMSEFSKGSFFLYCLKKYITEIAIILIISITSLGKTFTGLYCIYKGAAVAMLVSAATATYGEGGLLLYIMSIFPHYFMYVPMIVFTIFLGIKIRENVKKDKLIIPVVKGIMIEFVLIAATAALEAYCNYPFIKNVFQ